MATKTFTVGWLYPDLMNIYGDRGNILTLLKRAEWRDFDARLIELGRGTTKGMEDVDVFFFGGGQDREQALVYEDLIGSKQPPLERAVAGGAGVLAVCGGYQLLGHYYQTADGERFPGIGLIDVRTEGCLQGAILGTYLHGSLLPKNPHLADHLIRSALERRGIKDLAPLDDAAEIAAHEQILARAPR